MTISTTAASPATAPETPIRPTRRARNLAASMAGFSARHRFLAIAGWLVFVAAATALLSSIGTIAATDVEYGNGESRRANEMIAAAGFTNRAGEMVLVHSDQQTVDDPAFRAALAAVTTAVRGSGLVENLRSPADGGPDLVSTDRHAALVTFDMAGDAETASERVGPVVEAVAAAGRAHPTVYVGQAGEASIDAAIGETIDSDLHRLSMLSIPLTLGILIVAFGALLAAVLPLGLALTAFVASLGLLAAATRLAPSADTTAHLMLLIGLAVGVDYCLFYIRREREERANGASPRAALATAAATSGRSILISGLTVMIAMAGMFFTRDTTFVSFAVGTILVVATAVLGSLTVLPALLSLLGDRVDLGRIPGLYRRRSDGRIWSAVLGAVLRKPGLSAALAAATLGALALPALGLHTAQSGIGDFPRDIPVLHAFERIQRAFPGGGDPAVVVVRAPDVRTAEVTDAIADFKARALATGQLYEPVTVETNSAGTVSVIRLGLSGTGTDAASEQAIRTLRDDVVPTTLGAVGGAEVAVTGSAADSIDFNDALSRSAPLVFAFVLGLAFILLLVAFRSLVVAITSILLNLLSVAAAYGLLVLVFQDGWGERLLNFESTGAITNWLPLFLFVILFGLSMDYHVFVLSRIREGYDRGLPTRIAVASGIQGTAGVITSAAVVMVAVFSLFMTMSLGSTKQMGLGLAAAVFIDATIVRAVLLPSVMALLGDRNWYLPRWLNWLPRLSHGT